MATTPTNKPIPSEDPRDLKFNAGKIDEEVNGSADYYTDRFGVQRLTNNGRNKQFQDAQNQREYDFQQFLLNSGYQFLGDYENGPYTITARNQIIRYQNEFWRLNAATNPPYSTTGINSTSWATDVTHLVSVGDANLRQELSAKNSLTAGDTLIGMTRGGTLANTVMYFTPDQDGAIGDGVNDDSDHVQNIFNKASAAAIATPSGIFIPQTVKINRTYRVTKTLTIDGSKVRVESDAGGCLYFDPAGTYTNNRGIVVTNNANLAAFIGNAKPLFSGISFLTTGNTLDLFYAVRGDAVSPNNGACLHHITSCVFRGFNRLFTHGAGGWGWVWMACTATNTQFWLYLTSEADTYERHSFFGCQWGSGGTALYINNSNGKVYWEAGSVDYCTSIATVVSGHFSMSGHYEFTGRTASLIDITGSNASVSLEGMWAIVGNTSTVWYLVNQYQDYQLSIDKMTVIHDGNNAGSGLFSNKKFRKGYIYFPSDAAKLMGYFSSDAELLLNSSGYFDFSLSNSALTTASISGGQLRYTGVGGSGATSYLYVDIPVHGASQISFMLTASYTSTLGPMVITKQLLTSNKTLITTLTEGTASWAAGASSVTGGMRTMKEIPPGASFLRLVFNGFYLNSTTSFNIESLKLWRS